MASPHHEGTDGSAAEHGFNTPSSWRRERTVASAPGRSLLANPRDELLWRRPASPSDADFNPCFATRERSR